MLAEPHGIAAAVSTVMSTIPTLTQVSASSSQSPGSWNWNLIAIITLAGVSITLLALLFTERRYRKQDLEKYVNTAVDAKIGQTFLNLHQIQAELAKQTEEIRQIATTARSMAEELHTPLQEARQLIGESEIARENLETAMVTSEQIMERLRELQFEAAISKTEIDEVKANANAVQQTYQQALGEQLRWAHIKHEEITEALKSDTLTERERRTLETEQRTVLRIIEESTDRQRKSRQNR